MDRFETQMKYEKQFSPDNVSDALNAKHNTLFSQSWQLLEQLAGVAATGRDLKVSLREKDFWLQTLGLWCEFWVTRSWSVPQSLQNKYKSTPPHSKILQPFKMSAKTHSLCDKGNIISFYGSLHYIKG